MKYEDLKKELLKNPQIQKEYDSLEPEYQLVREIIQARIERSMTQQDLADITGINRSDISKLENGNANPSLKTLKRIAEGLGKKIEIKLI